MNLSKSKEKLINKNRTNIYRLKMMKLTLDSGFWYMIIVMIIGHAAAQL